MFKQFLKHTPFGISLLVLFTAIAFLLLIMPIFGNKTLIVRTGSMSPKIAVGDLIFVWPKQNYRVGNIIAFKEEGRGQTTITHRITAVKTQNNQIFYQTKGDANKQADQTLVPKSSVLGSADYSIRGIGKIFAMVKTKNGFLLTAILPAALVIILELVNIANALKKPKVYASSSVIPSPVRGNRTGRGNLLNRLLRRQSQPAFFRSHPRPDRGSDTVLSQSKDSRFRENDTSNLGYGRPMGLNVPSASIQSFVALILEKINIRSLKPSAGLPYYATSFKALFPYAIVVLIFTGTTLATTYSDSEESTGNIFRAAASYPSSNPSPTPSPSASPSPSPTPNPIAQTLVINEFLWDSSCGNNANQEAANYWLELFNGSAVTINLKDWQFKDANNNIIQISNANKFLDPGEYIVITKDGSVFNGCYSLQGTPETANLDGSAGFLPVTTGGVVKLEEPDGSGGFNVVDRVQYGPSQNGGVLNAPEDQSIARSPNGVDTALGDTFNASDFVIDSSPTPGVTN